MKRIGQSAGVNIAVSVALFLALVPLGCGLLTGSSEPTDSSAIAGNVVGDNAGHAAGVQARSAAAAGVVVRVEGTDLKATTQSDGSFSITGVSAGMVTLTFTYQGGTTSAQIEVPKDSRVILRNITLGPDGVKVGSMEIESLPGSGGSGNSNTNTNSNSNTNTNTNTNTNGNSNANSNSNTNTNSNTNSNSNTNTNSNSNANSNTNSNSNTNTNSNSNSNSNTNTNSNSNTNTNSNTNAA